MAQDAGEGRDQTIPAETIANPTHAPDPEQGIALRAAQLKALCWALADMMSPVGAAVAGLACGRWLVRGR